MSGDGVAVTVVGNLTADAELRFTPSGAAVARFTVASTPRVKGKDGEWRDGDATFTTCIAWRGLAEHVAESLRKGTRALVTGRLRQRSFEKNGERRTVFEVEVDEIGPSLKFATATVNRATRSNAPTGDDPWAIPTEPTEPPF